MDIESSCTRESGQYGKQQGVLLSEKEFAYAEWVAENKVRSVDFLKRAGIINDKGRLSRQYR